MSTIDNLRTSLLANVKNLVPAGVAVLEARVPIAAYTLAVNMPAVVVCYAGKPKREAGPIGNRGKQGYVYAFTISIVAGNWQAPADAAYEAANLAETIFGSPQAAPGTPNLRTVPLATIGDETVYLRFVSETLEIDPGSTPQGGKFAIVQQWESDQVRV